MTIELKIKNKHLSEEARIIRFEERKIKARARSQRANQYHKEADETMEIWFSLNSHRRVDVRNENRATFIARAYLAGKEYSFVEQKRNDENEYIFQTAIISRVVAMINKYKKFEAPEVTKTQILEWSKLT